jgi:hypothetical protein
MSKPSFDIIPKISIHPDSINVYNEIHWTPFQPGKPRVDHLKLSDKKTHGKVSAQAHRKVNKAINYLLYMADSKQLPNTAHGKNYNFKIAFITLTLPSCQVHSDDEIKSLLLNQFFVELRLRHKVKNYLWRAEKQKNGNIHFHVLVDKFVPWSDLRDRWNRICNKLGYVDRYRDQMIAFHSSGFKVRKELLSKWEYKAQVKAYKAGKANDWNSPNSTDIHSLYKISKVKAYISKYCTKNDTNAEVNGRLWGCNYELTDIKGAVMELDYELKSELNEIIKEYKPKIYTSDYFSVIYISSQTLQQTKYKRLFDIFSQYMLSAFNYNIQQHLTVN